MSLKEAQENTIVVADLIELLSNQDPTAKVIIAARHDVGGCTGITVDPKDGDVYIESTMTG